MRRFPAAAVTAYLASAGLLLTSCSDESEGGATLALGGRGGSAGGAVAGRGGSGGAQDRARLNPQWDNVRRMGIGGVGGAGGAPGGGRGGDGFGGVTGGTGGIQTGGTGGTDTGGVGGMGGNDGTGGTETGGAPGGGSGGTAGSGASSGLGGAGLGGSPAGGAGGVGGGTQSGGASGAGAGGTTGGVGGAGGVTGAGGGGGSSTTGGSEGSGGTAGTSGTGGGGTGGSAGTGGSPGGTGGVEGGAGGSGGTLTGGAGGTGGDSFGGSGGSGGDGGSGGTPSGGQGGTGGDNLGGSAGTGGDAGSGGSGGSTGGTAGDGGTGGTSGGSGGSAGTGGVLPTAVIAVVAGGSHTCAKLDNLALRCWGNGANGELGYANANSIGNDPGELPSSAGDVAVGGAVSQVVTGGQHTCALLQNGTVRCWGSGTSGQLGYGNTNSIGVTETPASLGTVDVGGTVTQLAAGDSHTCALLSAGNVRCWGHGVDGQLGYGNPDPVGKDETPSSAGDVDVGGVVIQIAAGSSHTCALLSTGDVRCWGRGQYGRLGYGNQLEIGDNEFPSSVGSVDLGGATVIQIAAGYHHTCALLSTGNVMCWGRNQFGQLGYGNMDSIGDNETPAAAGPLSLGGPVTQIALGKNHGCALLASQVVRCWGDSLFGQLGYNSTNNIGDGELPSTAGPVNVGANVSSLDAGGSHTCVVTTGGEVRCWGLASSGQLGYGSTNTIGDNELPSSAGSVSVF